MTYINITKFVLINQLEKDHSMIETRRLKNAVIFIQTILKKHSIQYSILHDRIKNWSPCYLWI